MFINVSKLSDTELRQLASMPIAEVATAAQKEIVRRQNSAVAGLVAAAADKFVVEFRDIFNMSELEPVTIVVRTTNRTFSFQYGQIKEKSSKRWPAGSREQTAQLVREVTGWDSDMVERRLRYGWKIFARSYPTVAAQVAEKAG